MPKTVNAAFNEFHKDMVNLDSDRTRLARSSRDWLINQLNNFPTKIIDFPILYESKHIKFGSFARNTKIKPLDDIDLFLTFNAAGASYTKSIFGDNTYTILVPEESKKLRNLCNDNELNSIKVVNKLVSSLSEIEHYKHAAIHRRQEAATLELSSYEWKFDIVPAFYTDTEFYLIPDGEGKWKATDPRMDQYRVSTINQKHNGKILQIIRTLKYWQKRPTMPTISSYLFETIILNYYDEKTEVSEYIDIELMNFFNHLINAIYESVLDPKGFQGELNTLDYDTKYKISELAKKSYNNATQAFNFETTEDDMQKAINKWGEVFGSDFPSYG